MFHMSYLIAVNDIFMCLDISVPFFILEVLSLSPSLLSSSVDSVWCITAALNLPWYVSMQELWVFMNI